jgi:hypothetical protein
MENQINLSIDLKIEEFARELGLQLRLTLLERKPEKQASLDKIVKPIAAPQASEKSKGK